MSEEHSCDNCGSPTSNEPMCLCDACNDAEADMAAARATAHAAGYAEAVADVVADLREKANYWGGPGVNEVVTTVLRNLASRYDSGAHVGAAKKGGGV